MVKLITGLSAITLVLLGGCGGGSSSDKKTPGERTGGYEDSERFKNKCEFPRSGRSEITGIPFPDQQGSSVDEKTFLRSWSHETYLWYKELPDINPANSDTPQQYFSKLKTNETTSSGKPKDNFHFYHPTEEFETGDAGMTHGYGMEIKAISARERVIAYVLPGSPAATASTPVRRGDRILELDGYILATENSAMGIAAMNDALYPDNLNEVHTFKFQRGDSTYEVNLESAQINVSTVTKTSVITQGDSKIGYIQFNAFEKQSQDEWVDAIDDLKSENIKDLVLDLRYNGGGYISIASMVGYMIGGTNVSGKTFIQYVENDRYPASSPIKFSTVGMYGNNNNIALPSLGFSRVYVLSTIDTCSASELVVNSLRGAGVDVYLVGDKTCGKPYGFTPEHNCGTTYYTIQFKGNNAKGFGEYSDGFIPAETDNGTDRVKGCEVADNLNYELGDQDEPLLATALHLRATGNCSTDIATNRLQKTEGAIDTGALMKSPLKKIAIYDL